MGIFDSVERGLERAVNGAFARTFRSGVQPVEIAAALKREIEIGSVVVDRDRVLAPNQFVVRVAPADQDRLLHTPQLEAELLAVIRSHASHHGYQFLAEPDVELRVDPSLTTGVLEVDASQVNNSTTWTPVIDVAGFRHEIARGTTTVGRGSDAAIRIDDTAASRQHLQIIWDGQAGIARDLGSTNGSKINGQRFREAALVPGTVITIGQTALTFQLIPTRAPRTTAVPPVSSRPAPTHNAPPTAAPKSSQPGIEQDFWRGL